jgi:hypothetical protein
LIMASNDPSSFAAPRAIENAPHCEVVANVLELMLDTSSHEQ